MKGMLKTIPSLLFGVILSFLAVADVLAVQYARPSSTISTGSFTATGAATLHEAIDEAAADDNDYITSPESGTASAEFGLTGSPTAITDPATSAGHILRFRMLVTRTGTSATVDLYEGATLRASMGSLSPATQQVWQTFTYTLTAGEANAISNYNNLRVRISPSGLAKNKVIEVSWTELEVPDPVTASAPTVTTPTFTNVTDTTATLGGTVTADGGSTVTSRGVEWSTTSGGPYTSVSAAAGGTGAFTVPVSGLPSGSLIYFRAWATNTTGTGYSSESSFTTRPTVTAPTFTNVTDTTATLGGTVSSTGSAAVTARGTVWGTAPNPTGNALSQGTGNGTFTHSRTGLPSGTLIYFRAYATNAGGTSYSADSTFTTRATVTSPTFGNVADHSADLGATVSSSGPVAVTDRGTVWGTAPNPTGNALSQGAGNGTFSHSRTGLPSGTLIYFRGYADNGSQGGRAYSADGSFTTLPTVSLPTFADVTSTTATLGGTVASDGAAAVTARGVEWGTAPGSYPNSVPSGSGNGTFTVPVAGLPPGTTIYFRAWASNVQGTGYSAESSFTTQAGAPTVTTPTFADVTDTTATLGGNVTSDGGGAVTSRGVEWGTTPGSYPNNVPAGTGGTGVFTVPVTGLPAGAVIYFRAWATNSGDTGYSTESSFTTLPTVSAPTFADVTDTTATLGGTVAATAPINDKGVEWGVAPGTYPNNVPTGSGGSGPFTVPVTGLPAGTTIYFRAWATNLQGTAYSAESSFATDPGLPTVNSPTFANVTQTTATLGGTVVSDGGAALSDKGVEWSTTQGGPYTSVATGTGGTGPFTVPVTGLPANTLIYFRAWATNTAGTGYSAESSFTTLSDSTAPTVTLPTFSAVTASTATLGGNVTSDGNAAITERGTVWGLAANPDIATGTKNIVAGTTGVFSGPVTGLNTGTQIHFRAYATNSAGTGYSPNASFYTEPAQSPASVTIDTVTAGSFRITWPAPGAGNGTGTLVVVRAGSAVSATPTDGVEHLASVTFGSGADLGTQQYVVFRGTGTQVTVSGLSATTTYHVAAFYYAGTGTGASGVNYKQTAPAVNNATTTAASNEPTVQVTNLNADQVASRAMRLRWTKGNGDGTIVTVRAQGTPAVPPVDFQDYAADPDYSLAPETSPGSSNYVVYKGAGTLVNVSGLVSDSTYVITAYTWGAFTTETDYLLVNAPEITQATDGPAMHNLDNAASCGDCHSNHSNSGLIPYGTAQEDVCRTCHQETGPASGKLEFALHLTPNYGDVDPDCGSCHEVHAHNATNTTLSTNPVTLQQANNLAFIRANVDKYITTATTEDAVYHTLGDDLAIEGGDASTSRGICQACHTQTSYHTNNTALEASQCHRGGANDTCDASQVNCTSCHSHTGNFAPSGGSCTGCHNSPQNGGFPTGRRAIMGEFSLLSHHVSGTVSEADCEVCHAQSGAGATTHTHMDGWLTLWNVDDHNADAIQLGDHANPFTDSAEATKLTQFCLNCHDSNGAAAETTPLAPFTGSGAPPVIDATHWANSSHNTGGAASPVTCFGNGQGGCHASGHGSEKQWLLAPYTVPATDPDRSEEREDFCFTCHDGDGMSTLDIFADFNGTLRTTTSGSGALVNNRHDVLPTDQSRSGGLVTCKNCHNQHQNNNANPVADPDNDATLPSYSISNVYNEDGHNFSYDSGGNLNPLNPEGCAGTPGCTPTTEPDYIKFCLACHDGTTPPGVTMAPNMVNLATAWSADDQHGRGVGSSGASTSKGGLKVPWVSPTTAQSRCTPNDNAANCDPSAGYAAMNCTTCHGAHGGPNIYNLRTSINVAGVTMTVGGVGNLNEAAYNGSTTYTLPLIGGAQTDHYWGAWCTFCHKMDSHPGKVQADACTNGHMHAGGAF